ncbi:MAG: hypothetical protein JF599_11935 [Verrucomicrobia bacterium]|nr:hypothetical protein [Verrucomicrobiota bacterium]
MVYRSRLAKYAALGGHWQVAKEQFKILGDNWDQRTFSKSEYAQMTKAADEGRSE